MHRAPVTVGDRGIDPAVGAGLLEAGLDVVIGARDARGGRRPGGPRCGARPKGFEAALAEAGDLDALVDDAGVLRDVSPIARDADFEEAMQVTVHGPWDLIHRREPIAW